MADECNYGVPLKLHYPGNCLNCEIDQLQAKLQVAYAWIIAQDTCPECYGHLKPVETVIGNVRRIDAECCECGRMWKSFGDELTWEEWNLWKTDAQLRLGVTNLMDEQRLKQFEETKAKDE